jgi:hypothetical protein
LAYQGARRHGTGPAALPATIAACGAGCTSLTCFHCRTRIQTKQMQLSYSKREESCDRGSAKEANLAATRLGCFM